MRRVFPLLLVLFGLALATPAPAAPAPLKKVTNPDWVRKPSPEDISRYYPPLAQQHDIGGRARVQCRLANDGVLSDCVVLSEAPTGYGFGEAALNVATRFQMRPGTHDGRPIAGQIIVPIVFRPQDPGFTAVARPSAALAVPFFLLFVDSVIGWLTFF
jgi:TonB family protein